MNCFKGVALLPKGAPLTTSSASASASAPAPATTTAGTKPATRGTKPTATPHNVSVLTYNLLAPTYVRPIDKRSGEVQPFAAFPWVKDDYRPDSEASLREFETYRKCFVETYHEEEEEDPATDPLHDTTPVALQKENNDSIDASDAAFPTQHSDSCLLSPLHRIPRYRRELIASGADIILLQEVEFYRRRRRRPSSRDTCVGGVVDADADEKSSTSDNTFVTATKAATATATQKRSRGSSTAEEGTGEEEGGEDDGHAQSQSSQKVNPGGSTGGGGDHERVHDGGDVCDERSSQDADASGSFELPAYLRLQGYDWRIPAQRWLSEMAERNERVLGVPVAVGNAVLWKRDQFSRRRPNACHQMEQQNKVDEDDDEDETNEEIKAQTCQRVSVCLEPRTRSATSSSPILSAAETSSCWPLVAASIHCDATDESKRCSQLKSLLVLAREVYQTRSMIIAGDMNTDMIQGTAMGRFDTLRSRQPTSAEKSEALRIALRIGSSSTSEGGGGEGETEVDGGEKGKISENGRGDDGVVAQNKTKQQKSSSKKGDTGNGGGGATTKSTLKDRQAMSPEEQHEWWEGLHRDVDHIMGETRFSLTRVPSGATRAAYPHDILSSFPTAAAAPDPAATNPTNCGTDPAETDAAAKDPNPTSATHDEASPTPDDVIIDNGVDSASGSDGGASSAVNIPCVPYTLDHILYTVDGLQLRAYTDTFPTTTTSVAPAEPAVAAAGNESDANSDDEKGEETEEEEGFARFARSHSRLGGVISKGIPSVDSPSDHLPIGAVFSIRDRRDPAGESSNEDSFITHQNETTTKKRGGDEKADDEAEAAELKEESTGSCESASSAAEHHGGGACVIIAGITEAIESLERQHQAEHEQLEACISEEERVFFEKKRKLQEAAEAEAQAEKLKQEQLEKQQQEQQQQQQAEAQTAATAESDKQTLDEQCKQQNANNGKNKQQQQQQQQQQKKKKAAVAGATNTGGTKRGRPSEEEIALVQKRRRQQKELKEEQGRQRRLFIDQLVMNQQNKNKMVTRRSNEAKFLIDEALRLRQRKRQRSTACEQQSPPVVDEKQQSQPQEQQPTTKTKKDKANKSKNKNDSSSSTTSLGSQQQHKSPSQLLAISSAVTGGLYLAPTSIWILNGDF